MIRSDIVFLDSNLTREEIEKQLADNCGEVVRWAIIGVTDNKLKICVSILQ